MRIPIIAEGLRTLIAPLLPSPKPQCENNSGRLPVSNRVTLTGIPFVSSAVLILTVRPSIICWNTLLRASQPETVFMENASYGKPRLSLHSSEK